MTIVAFVSLILLRIEMVLVIRDIICSIFAKV